MAASARRTSHAGPFRCGFMRTRRGRMNSALPDQIEARVAVRYNFKPSKRGRRACLPRFAYLPLAHRKNAVSTAPVSAILALADGTLFRGQAIGASAASAGEVVFNTAMTGYQEILTDPSYAGQIVTLTYPHIGNTGVNAEDVESKRIFAAGLVIRDLPRVASADGIKHNVLRRLAERGCRMTVVPAQTTAKEALARKPDGIFLSNGPGDPEPCEYAIGAIRKFLEVGIPTFGICLGHQLLGLAVGGKTLKMKFGHHGANHPVLDKDTGQVLITSQNHGFAVDPASLPQNVRVTHVSLFDGSLQGIARTDRPAFSFQGHPEASPGPHDVGYLFDRFIKVMESRR